MAKTENTEHLEQEIKKLTNALKKSNENMKILQKQLFLNEEHFISANIKANDKLLEHIKNG